MLSESTIDLKWFDKSQSKVQKMSIMIHLTLYHNYTTHENTNLSILKFVNYNKAVKQRLKISNIYNKYDNSLIYILNLGIQIHL